MSSPRYLALTNIRRRSQSLPAATEDKHRPPSTPNRARTIALPCPYRPFRCCIVIPSVDLGLGGAAAGRDNCTLRGPLVKKHDQHVGSSCPAMRGVSTTTRWNRRIRRATFLDTFKERKYHRSTLSSHSKPATPFSDLDAGAVERKLHGNVIGSRVHFYESLDSTMDEARRLAEEADPEGTVVVADEQTAGRGRFDRSWVAPSGLDLLFSVLLRPSAEHLRYVNMAASLAICGVVAEVCGLKATVKWPNDVRVGGRKIAGILIDSVAQGPELQYAVLGIGLNVNSDPAESPEIAATATSLRNETGRTLERGEVLVALLGQLDDLHGEIKKGASLTERWAKQVETISKLVQVRWGDKVYEGLAREVDDDGNLVLVQRDGTALTMVAGEVTLQQ